MPIPIAHARRFAAAITVKSNPQSVLAVRFTRGRSEGVVVEIRHAKEDSWTEAGRFFNSHASIKIAATDGNAPQQILLLARYLRNNAPVGRFSNIVICVTTP